MFSIDVSIQMGAVFALIVAAFLFYARESVPMELTSLAVIAVLLVFFFVFPLRNKVGENVLDAERILKGFASPPLITIAGLLVVGQGLTQTGALDKVANFVFAIGGRRRRTIGLVMLTVVSISAFLNNTPVVVMFIPIMQVLAQRIHRSPSSLMMPLSFAAILGGMTTLIGSSTNLLVAGELAAFGRTTLSFFDFTVPAMALAGIGLVYVVFAVPFLLPDRASLASRLLEGGGKQFIANLTVLPSSKLVGASAVGGFFAELPEITVRMIQQGEHAVLPPFEGMTIQQGDVLVVAATRKALTEALHHDPNLSGVGEIDEGERPSRRPGSQMLAEVMIAPASRMIGQNLEQIGFRHRYNCIVVGIQRRSRMIRSHITDIRLEAGDVLLIQGRRADIRALRGNPDLLLMEWSATDLPRRQHARLAGTIFAVVVVVAATGFVPIVIAAVGGAALMVAFNCLNVRQATRAVDRNIILLIAAALALGSALQETGGAAYFAERLVSTLDGAAPSVVLSAFFLLVAMMTNVISNNACAVLFTPIAINIADRIGVDVMPFAIAVVFAANCSFASPIGYQTNLLVMGPGHYRFIDFSKAGLPLVFIIWAAFSLFAPWYYGFK